MASITGTINYVNVGTEGDVCCISVATSTGNSTKLLWSYIVQDDTAENRILHSMWLGMARDAIKHGLNIRITNDSGSSLATLVELQS